MNKLLKILSSELFSTIEGYCCTCGKCGFAHSFSFFLVAIAILITRLYSLFLNERWYTLCQRSIEGILITTKPTKSVTRACILKRKFNNLQDGVISFGRSYKMNRKFLEWIRKQILNNHKQSKPSLSCLQKFRGVLSIVNIPTFLSISCFVLIYMVELYEYSLGLRRQQYHLSCCYICRTQLG